MPEPYGHGGKQNIPGVGTRERGGAGSSGYRKPSYTGADKARSSSKGTMASGASPYKKGGGGGGAKAGNGPKNKKPGQGPMGVGAARGSDSFPTKNSAKRHTSGSPGETMKRSKVRDTSSHRPSGY